MNLVWVLNEVATRTNILSQTMLQLDEKRRGQVYLALEQASIEEKHHHDLSEVLATIDSLVVSERVKEHMRQVYQILAQAEAQVHGCSIDETHFHEVGNAEAIRNVLAVCVAVEAFAPAHIIATPVQTGEGTVICAHGELAIPAPATAAILDSGIPLCDFTFPGERCTPTSAALIAHFVDEYCDNPLRA